MRPKRGMSQYEPVYHSHMTHCKSASCLRSTDIHWCYNMALLKPACLCCCHNLCQSHCCMSPAACELPSRIGCCSCSTPMPTRNTLRLHGTPALQLECFRDSPRHCHLDTKHRVHGLLAHKWFHMKTSCPRSNCIQRYCSTLGCSLVRARGSQDCFHLDIGPLVVQLPYHRC